MGLGRTWLTLPCLQTFIAMGDVSAGIKHAVSCRHSDGLRPRPGGGDGRDPTGRRKGDICGRVSIFILFNAVLQRQFSLN